MSDDGLESLTGVILSRSEIDALKEKHSSVVLPNQPTTRRSKKLYTPPNDGKSYKDRGPEYFCRYCGAYVHKSTMQQHIDLLHPNGQVVSKKTKPLPPTSPQRRVRCEYCRASIKESRMARHIRKAHPAKPIPSIQETKPVPPVGLVKCQFCSAFLKPANMEKHNRRLHRSQLKPSLHKPKQAKSASTKQDLSPAERDTRAESVYQSDYEARFGGKYVGQYRREFDGKFGSTPLHDDYGDEAGAD